MSLFANTPGVQFYTGNFLDGVDGKAGAKYEKHHGFCLETQYYPDSINQPQFPSCLLKPGEVYSHSMLCKFGTA
jgi:aldose 1-epimerase|eukprot:COSAG02_NODE_55_length_43887_cov_30.660364_2_plen_74_part_00